MADEAGSADVQPTPRRSIDSLTISEIKHGIVHMLESRTNASCKLDVVPKLTFKQLGFAPRGEARKNASARIRRALGALKKARIVKVYKATNTRVRLEADYLERFQKHLRRRGDARRWKTKSVDEEHIGQPTPTGYALSPLPALPDLLDEVEEEPDLLDEVEEEEEKDLFVRANEPKEISQKAGEPTPTVSFVPASQDAPERSTNPSPSHGGSGFLEALARDLSRLPGVNCEVTLGGVVAQYSVETLTLRSKASCSPDGGRLQASTELPFVEEAVLPLLAYHGGTSTQSRLGMITYGSERRFVLRYTATPKGTVEAVSALRSYLAEVAESASLLMGFR